MKKIVYLIIAACAGISLKAQEAGSFTTGDMTRYELKKSVALSENPKPVKYHRVLIPGDEKMVLHLLALGITLDHSDHDENGRIVAEISDYEVDVLKQNKIEYSVLINDVAKYYEERNKTASDLKSMAAGVCNAPNVPVPANFHLGSMGGFFTFTEMQQILDSMQLLYPNLITVKTSLFPQSVENRPIYWVKISDNPNVDEPEPEILYTALHHAREPQSLSQLIFFMWYLLENYATNPEVQSTINNTELYIVPCVNPDGYVYNQTTNPNGGGMWRKNRRNNNNGSYGVDLNRNYGYNWGYDNVGSSPTTISDTYRGTFAFSEPEIQAMRNFCNGRQFVTALNAHTYGNLLVYPWGYLPSYYTPDSSTFVNWGVLLTQTSRFKYGTGDQTVNYVTNGDSDDWMYGEQNSKPKILSMTPEAGSSGDGFWPASSRIIDICKVTFNQNYYLAFFAGQYAIARDRQDKFLSGSGYLKYNIQRYGLTPGPFTVNITPVGNDITGVGAPNVYPSLAQNQNVTDSISFTLNGGLTSGQKVKYVIGVNNGSFVHYDTISKIYGNPVTVYSDNGSSATANYTASGTWGLSTAKYVSSPSSITDSPSGNYSNNANKSITTKPAADLTNSTYAHLQYYTRFSIQKNADKAQVLISTNNGASFSPLCGKYETSPASFGGSSPLYDGLQDGWVLEDIDLSAYVGQSVMIRFSFTSDFSGTDDGFYFDDVLIRKVSGPSASVKSNVLFSDNIALSPNPSSGIFNLYNPDQKKLDMEIYNVMGQKVFEQKNIETVNYSINLENNAAGIYFVKMKLDGEEVSRKVLKE